MNDSRGRELAERIRAACLTAARQGYADAAASGLCAAGAWEAALGAIEMLDLAPLLTTEVAADDDEDRDQTGI